MLITENTDDLHNQEVKNSPLLMKEEDKHFVKNKQTEKAFTPHVYEIHGNL